MLGLEHSLEKKFYVFKFIIFPFALGVLASRLSGTPRLVYSLFPTTGSVIWGNKVMC